MKKTKWIPKPKDCEKCNRCYRHRVEEMAVISFIFGMLGALLMYELIMLAFTR